MNTSDDITTNIAYLQLKYGLSKECYHELTMLSEDLPRSYRVSYVTTRIYVTGSAKILHVLMHISVQFLEL